MSELDVYKRQDQLCPQRQYLPLQRIRVGGKCGEKGGCGAERGVSMDIYKMREMKNAIRRVESTSKATGTAQYLDCLLYTSRCV